MSAGTVAARIVPFAVLALACLAAGRAAYAEVTEVAVESRRDVASGASFGLAGPYEALAGRISFEVDPGARMNRAVADIGYAATNAAGRVEFTADFYLLKPKEAARGNGTLLFEVSNRGGKGMPGMLNRAAGSLAPVTAEHVGDGFLLRHGFTLLWVGWQFDVPPGDDLLRVYVPAAIGASGLVRSDFVVRERVDTHSLGDRNMTAYPAADPGSTDHVMTVRDAPLADRETVPRSRWRFARRDGDRVVDDPRSVHLDGGFDPHRIYEVVYRSENPPVAGLGLAAVRDAVSFLKHENVAEIGLQSGDLTRAIGFGISQSGRFLRTFLHDGFNEDEQGRIVFDGLMPHIAGGARGSFNHRFAQPSRASWSFFYPNALFPFADVEQTDGRQRGSLQAAVQPRHRPKIMYTNSSNEYWRGSAALTHVTIDGRADLELPDDVRIYLFAGTQHVPARASADDWPERGQARHPANPNDYDVFLRALLVRMQAWIAAGVPPPPSRYPRLDDGTLAAPSDLRFPALPYAAAPPRVRPVPRIDHGPAFRAERVATFEPPRIGAPYPLLLAQVDEDGNELAGLISPELAAPLATYTGWNPFRPPFGPEDELVSLQGAVMPFARTRAARQAAGDPRVSVEERYPTRADFIGRVAEHAAALAAQGYLLGEDLPRIIARAGARWTRAQNEARNPSE